MSFKAYLEKQRHRTTSIKAYLWKLKDYKNWCTQKGYDTQLLDYKALMQYVKYLQAKNWRAESVNNQIRCVQYYYDYLIESNIRVDNPATGLKVKRSRTKVMANLLTYEELEDLYYSFESDHVTDKYFKATAKRNKVITGLIVYQCLNTATLAKLQLEDVQLHKGKIDVPGTTKSNPRTLPLQSWQIIELMEYIERYRPKIQKRIKLYNDTLFPLNTPQFNMIQRSIIKKLKTVNHKVVSLQQLRASVITYWLGKYNIREVQQMCGHKYIGSTERYQQDNLENLHKAIQKFHPLG